MTPAGGGLSCDRTETSRSLGVGSALLRPAAGPVAAPPLFSPPAGDPRFASRWSPTLHPTPTVLGLLGGIGAGKSHVARRLAVLVGAAVVDADREATRALAVCAADGRLAALLGPESAGTDGTPDRAAIARRVFDDDGALRGLEALVHPLVLEHIERRVHDHRGATGPALLVLDVPLLLERNLDALCDVLWFVEVPEALRQERAAARGLSPAEIRRRERRHVSLARKRERADLVIHNDADLDPQLTRGLADLGLPSSA